MTNIEQFRQQFSGLNNKFYFNFGGQGVLSNQSFQAMVDTYNYVEKIGPFGLKINSWLQQQTTDLKLAIANELKVAQETITITENVTVGCNIALWGIDWQQNDEIVLTDAEHPSIIGIVQEIQKRFKVKIITCKITETLNQGNPLKVIENSLTANTRLVILSHVLWNTGQVLPLQEIVNLCHHYPNSNQKIQVLVDGAQSVGCLPLNLTETNVDFYAFTGHKWLCGASGVGGLYISPNSLNSVAPTFIGWRGFNFESKDNIIGFKKDGSKFEVATSAYPLFVALKTAINVHNQWGSDQIRYQRICQLSNYLWQKLNEIEEIECLKTTPPESGLVSFIVKKNISSNELVKKLENEGFFLRTIANPACIRACVHYLTLESDILQLVNQIKLII